MTGFENALTEGMKPQLTRNVETGNQPEIAARFQSPSPFALLDEAATRRKKNQK